MSAPSFLMPREAVAAMVAHRIVFSIRQRDDGLGVTLTYRVGDGGDLQACRRILAAVKARPPAFFEGFKAQVQRIVGGAE